MVVDSWAADTVVRRAAVGGRVVGSWVVGTLGEGVVDSQEESWGY